MLILTQYFGHSNALIMKNMHFDINYILTVPAFIFGKNGITVLM